MARKRRRAARQRQQQRNRDGPPRKVVTAEDFSKKAVQKHVKSEAWQHPVTIIPLAAGAVGLVAGAALVAPVASATGIGLLFVGGASFIWNYVGRGASIAEDHLNKLKQLRESAAEHQAIELRREMEYAGFEGGAKEARELSDAYNKLRKALDTHFGEQDITAQRFRILAKDTYAEGLGILRRALGIFNALQSVEIKTLERELKSLRKKLEKLGEDDSSRGTLSQQIGSHSQRVEQYDARKEQVQQLLTQSDELESVLEQASFEVLDLTGRDSSAMFRDEGTATRLKRAVDAARRVEDRIRGVEDSEHIAQDRKYLELAERNQSN